MILANNESYVLLVKNGTYFVEYLLHELVLSDSITEAMTFDDSETAHKFKQMLFERCKLDCSVNTYIP
tara:strand:+ start:740 stop:943 length:204 start_codon:yes stop_codon:yes gene_type:complete